MHTLEISKALFDHEGKGSVISMMINIKKLNVVEEEKISSEEKRKTVFPEEVKSSWVFKDEEMLKKSRRVKGFLATETSPHGVIDTRSGNRELEDET